MTDQVQVNRYLCFPSTVYMIDVPQYVDAVYNVAKEYLKKVEDGKALDEVYPVFHTEDFSADQRIKDFTSYTAQVAFDILSNQGYAMDDKRTYFSLMWMQDHHRNSQMEQHVHNMGAQIVGFYFLDCPENCSKLILHDPRAGKVQINLPKKNPNEYSEADEMIVFEAKKGRLFFSNAWMPHSFTRHNSDQPIRFVHFNINVEQVINFAPVAEVV